MIYGAAGSQLIQGPAGSRLIQGAAGSQGSGGLVGSALMTPKAKTKSDNPLRMAGQRLIGALTKGPVIRGIGTAMRGGSLADIALNAGSMYTAVPNALSHIFTGQGMADNFQDGMSTVNRLNRESGYEGDSLRFPPMPY